MEEVYNIPYKLTNKKNHLRLFNKYASPIDYKLAHRIIYRYLSLPFILLFIKLKIKPNVISLLGIVIRFIGMILYLFFLRIPAVLIFQLGYIFDWCDGPVARATKQVSDFGRRLDPTVDLIMFKLFYLALPIGLYLNYKETLILVLALIFVTLLTIREMIGVWINAWVNVEEKHEYFKKREIVKAKHLFLSRIFIMIIDLTRNLFPFIVFFNLILIYYFYAFAAALELFRMLFELYSTFEGLHKGL